MKTKPDRSLIIPVDFDGTIVHHRFPDMGAPVPHAIRVLKRLVAAGHRIILWTCRSNQHLWEAVEYVRGQGVELHGWNSNRLGDEYIGNPKVYGHILIDDVALGCPCIIDDHGEKYVDWLTVERLLQGMGFLPPEGTIPTTEAA